MTGILWLSPIIPVDITYRYPNIQTQFIILQSGLDRQQWEHLIGKTFTITLQKECWNSRIQAVTVILPPSLPSQDITPHIALSWVDYSTPVESNNMLQEKHNSNSLSQTQLDCVVDFLEWNSPQSISKTWRDRNWKICNRPNCNKKHRSTTGYCRQHRPGINAR